MSGAETTHRLLYVSRNLLAGSPDAVGAQVDRILQVSRRNNARDGITGALLFSSSCFAQALEGSAGAIDLVFERIQRDERHRDTVVLAYGPAPREFGDWTMAYAGPVPEEAAAYRDLSTPGEAASNHVLDLLRKIVLR